MDSKEVGRTIARLRKAKGMTQKELADSLFVIDKTISRWECGYGLPSVDTLPKIADVLSVSVDELLGKEAKKEEQPTVIKKKSHWPWVLCTSLAMSMLVSCAIVIPISIVNAQKESRLASEKSWLVCRESNADYSFFTVFGNEEMVSLELNGDLQEGTFICHDSWSENDNDYYCMVTGDYLIGGDTMEKDVIAFHVGEVKDTLNTKKLSDGKAEDIAYFYGHLETENAEDTSFDGTELSFISFNGDETHLDHTLFGRYTEADKYFSRHSGDICFTRVIDHNFSMQQYASSPDFIAENDNVSLLKDIQVTQKPKKTRYHVGEPLDASGIQVIAQYTNGQQKDVTNSVTYTQSQLNDASCSAVFKDEYRIRSKMIGVEVQFLDSWKIVTLSNAPYSFLTYYETNDIKAFTSIELFGDLHNGSFLTSEVYGKNIWQYAVASGSYTIVDDEIQFMTTKTTYSKSTAHRFALSEEGSHFSAKIESQSAKSQAESTYNGKDIYAISFETYTGNRCFFGTYANDEPSEVGRTTGEIYLLKINDKQIPDIIAKKIPAEN